MIDLPAADAWYHVYCDHYFAMGCSMPQYALTDGQPATKRGRKELDEQMVAFKFAVDELFASEGGQMTVIEFTKIMERIISEGNIVYSYRHCKRLLENMLGDDVRVDSGLITLTGNARKVLNNVMLRLSF